MTRKRVVLLIVAAFVLLASGLNAGYDPGMSIVEPQGDVRRLAGLERCVYEVSSADESFTLPGTSTQQARVVQSGKGRTIVHVVCATRTDFQTANPATEYVYNSRVLNLTDERIRNEGQRLCSTSRPLNEVELFVNHRIADKRMGLPLLTARQIYDGRAGDCTEHAVLAVALLRAGGIPARAVLGLVFAPSFEGRRNVFVYHMWAEAWYQGRWQLVDATGVGEGRASRYIALTIHSLRTESPLEYIQTMTRIKDLSIRLLND